jgi:hypothetical protein
VPSPSKEPRTTDQLIALLAGDAKPVRRVWSPSFRVALWIACQALVLLSLGGLLGARHDLAVKLREPSFLVPLLLLAGSGLGAAVLALAAAVPDRKPARPGAAAIVAVALLVPLLAFGFEPAGAKSLVAWGHGWPCAVRTVGLALVPLAFLLVAIRRGATLVPAVAGVLAGAASFSVAAAAMRLICASDERWHLLAWHLVPIAIGVGFAGAIGARWLGGWLPREVGGPASRQP